MGALRLRGVMDPRAGVRQEQGSDSRVYLPSSEKAIGHLEPIKMKLPIHHPESADANMLKLI